MVSPRGGYQEGTGGERTSPVTEACLPLIPVGLAGCGIRLYMDCRGPRAALESAGADRSHGTGVVDGWPSLPRVPPRRVEWPGTLLGYRPDRALNSGGHPPSASFFRVDRRLC